MSFHNWAMSNGYLNNLTIDRKDNNGNYEPNNCRWVSMIVQANNKSNNRIITYNGQERTLAEWSRILKINKNTLSTRLNRDKKIKPEELFKEVGV